ncbi:MAG: DUF4139 domain-containing protein [Gammaproteobacteria bacterium]|nr:DUF4139 domain-containing protein [Gammaproteobacteria bacterium]
MKKAVWISPAALVLVFSIFGVPPAAAQSDKAREHRSTLTDQQEVAVTIYNQDLALVKDLRIIKLDKGFNKLAMREVSANIRPETALLRSIDGNSGLHVIEQNFDFDLLTPRKLLEKYVGRTVRLVKTHPQTGEERIEEATVLSANNGVVLKVGDRIEMGVPGRLVFATVPENLRDRPTLVMQLHSPTSHPQKLELSYLTGGLSWKADYVAELNADDNRLDLHGWVTLTNKSGTTYKKAKLQLVAGDVNRVRREMDELARDRKMAMAAESEVRADMAQESLFEYHLYTLNRPTTIADNQTKQVTLLTARDVPIKKQFLLKGKNYYYSRSYGDLGQKLKVGVYVQFENKRKANLGKPLPRGVIRVYKKDSAGNAQFVGEDSIDHTPNNEKVRLKLGDAFDVTADKKQTDFTKRATTRKYHYTFESAYEISLKNAKEEPVTVTIHEPVPGDWQILSETHRHQKAAAGTALWRITVPAEGTTTLRYRVLVRY